MGRIETEQSGRPGTLASRRTRQQFDIRNFDQSLGITGGESPAHIDNRGQAIELRICHRCGDIAHPQLRIALDRIVLACAVLGPCQQSAFAGRHAFGGIQAEDAEVTVASNRPPARRATEYRRAILDQRNARMVAQRTNRLDITDKSAVVHEHHRPGTFGEAFRHRTRRQCQRVGCQVGKYRSSADEADDVDNSLANNRSCDDLTSVSAQDLPQRDPQRNAAGTRGEGAPTEHCARSRLECSDLRTGGYPSRPDSTRHSGDIDIGHVRPEQRDIPVSIGHDGNAFHTNYADASGRRRGVVDPPIAHTGSAHRPSIRRGRTAATGRGCR